MFEEWMDQLSSCELFDGIGWDDIKSMLNCLSPRKVRYGKNESIAIEGEKLNSIGIVLDGEVAVSKENAQGERTIIEICKPGEIFGETAAFSGKGLWPATITAQKDSIVLFVAPGKIAVGCEKLCQSHRHLTMNMLKILSEKAIMLNRKVGYLSIKTLRGKISTFLIEQYERSRTQMLYMLLKRNELADFLGVSRPALSREMCRMRDEGIIEFEREAVKIKDMEALRRMAE